MVERNDYDAAVQEEVAEKISLYDDIDSEKGIQQDAVYGGYDGVVDKYDKQDASKIKHVRYDMIEGSTALDVMRFGCGSRLVTDGYDLIFVTAAGDAYVVVSRKDPPVVKAAQFECGTRWLKATDSQLLFVNVLGEPCILAADESVPHGVMELNIDDIYSSTVDTGPSVNRNSDNFVKFRGTRTVMFATPGGLYARFAAREGVYQLI